MKKIAAIIVTYNRLELLKIAITATREQSLKPAGIIIINNGSTDGTKEWLDAQADLIAIHQENCGGAGGFYRGMKEGYEKGYDYLWVMDDDGYPEKLCLEKLYANTARFENGLVALSSVVYNCDDKTQLCFKTPLVKKDNIKYFDIFLDPLAKFNFSKDPAVAFEDYKREGNLIEYLTYPFNSVMYSREIFTLVGFPMKELFIRGDELEFTLRIIKKGIPSFLVTDSIFYNPSQEEEDGKITSRWKIKYRVRNRVIVTKKYVPFGYSLVCYAYMFLSIVKQRSFYLLSPFLDGFISRYPNYRK